MSSLCQHCIAFGKRGQAILILCKFTNIPGTVDLSIGLAKTTTLLSHVFQRPFRSIFLMIKTAACLVIASFPASCIDLGTYSSITSPMSHFCFSSCRLSGSPVAVGPATYQIAS